MPWPHTNPQAYHFLPPVPWHLALISMVFIMFWPYKILFSGELQHAQLFNFAFPEVNNFISDFLGCPYSYHKFAQVLCPQRKSPLSVSTCIKYSLTPSSAWFQPSRSPSSHHGAPYHCHLSLCYHARPFHSHSLDFCSSGVPSLQISLYWFSHSSCWSGLGGASLTGVSGRHTGACYTFLKMATHGDSFSRYRFLMQQQTQALCHCFPGSNVNMGKV